MKTVFIDGKSGTTGLKIFERLSNRNDIKIIQLSQEERRNTDARKRAINGADIVFLCLPDDAAKESVSFVNNPDVVIIDTSTAHRTSDGWVYGFPELFENGDEIIHNSKRISVPGCHASGFNVLIRPLIADGLLPCSSLLSCFSVTGYSGGGKKMIEEYESSDRDNLLNAPRQYALSQQHKHLKEMKAISGLDSFPIFCPVVSDYYSGMCVTVPIFSSMPTNGYSINDIKQLYKNIYNSSLVGYNEVGEENGFISASAFSGKDSMEISVNGNEDRIILTARYDNLGKGASGAAVECLNLVIGTDKYKGLVL